MSPTLPRPATCVQPQGSRTAPLSAGAHEGRRKNRGQGVAAGGGRGRRGALARAGAQCLVECLSAVCLENASSRPRRHLMTSFIQLPIQQQIGFTCATAERIELRFRHPVHLSGLWCAWPPVCVPLGEGVSVATMAVPGNAVWGSKTLRKGLQSSQNVSGKVIEFYGLDLAP